MVGASIQHSVSCRPKHSLCVLSISGPHQAYADFLDVIILRACDEFHVMQQGGKRSRRSQAAPFVRNQVYEWHGDCMKAASASESEDSGSASSSGSEDSHSQDSKCSSEHESDLGGFIVAEEPAADDRDPDDENAGPGPSATAVSALLEEAGMVSSRTDKEHFTTYIEYLVYDLVDDTFAVRVRGDSRLRKHFDAAVRHVEESLAFKRCSFVLLCHVCLSACPDQTTAWQHDCPICQPPHGRLANLMALISSYPAHIHCKLVADLSLLYGFWHQGVHA